MKPKPTAEQRAHAAHFASHDPLRVALTELLKPVKADDEAILARVRELLTTEVEHETT